MRTKKRKKKRSIFAKLLGRNPAKKLARTLGMKWYPSPSVAAIGRERASRRRGKKGKA